MIKQPISTIQQNAALLLALLVFIFTGACIASERTLIYRHYDDKTGEMLKKEFATISAISSQEQKIILKTEGQGYDAVDEFEIDGQYMTQSWSKVDPGEQTHYSGERKGRTVYVKGLFKGQDIDKKIDLDDKPFYTHPPFNLTKFILSDQKHIKFWMIRDDRPAKMQMQAKKREEEAILINGVEMDVVKVACTKSGLREKHFKRFYYFRKSDGLFVKEVVSNGRAADLISIK